MFETETVGPFLVWKLKWGEPWLPCESKCQENFSEGGVLLFSQILQNKFFPGWCKNIWCKEIS